MLSKTASPFPIPTWLKEPDVLAAIASGILLVLGWLALHLGWVGLSLLLLPAAYVIGGYESAREGLTTLFEEKQLDVDLLMIVAALGAAGLGLWQRDYYLIVDGAMLILIFATSGALESLAMQRTERNIRSLMKLTLDTAWMLLHGQEQQVSITKLRVGDRILVKPGELIPTDGKILTGYSTLNESAITGESIPVEKTVGDEVFAGTLNGSGALELTLHKPPESSLIQRVIQLVEQAKTEAPPSQQFIQRFERGYAQVIVVTGILLMILPPFLGGWSWEITIYRALIFLVVASPCALMAAIMPTLLSGIANGARQGILFKSGAQLETMGRVQAIAFDKTGTLTTGQLRVDQVIPMGGESAAHLLQVGASLESYSEHPIGQAIAQAAQQQSLKTLAMTNVQATPGQGISGTHQNQLVKVGKVTFVAPSTHRFDPSSAEVQQVEQAEMAGKTVVWVAQAERVLGAIAVSDEVRPRAANLVATLKKLGVVQVVMLTGDNERTAHTVAQQTGVDQVYAGLLPEDKVTVIKRLQQQYPGRVAMVGDGINDAPALAQASVGIAMGAAGSDVALETADIVLMADRLEKLEQAIRLGRRSQRLVRQNIAIALGAIALLLIANFMGNITLPLGVIGHEGSTLIVTLNGLRLLRS
jgi:Cd2+/Zn2+-exporting ATPase